MKRLLNIAAVCVLLVVSPAFAQMKLPLAGNGWMGLGSANGALAIEQEDLNVKVPGGYVRINRDFDGITNRWTFNRQWSGLGSPSFYRAHYPTTMGKYFTCTTIDGVGNCDQHASPGSTVVLMPSGNGGLPDVKVEITRILNDPYFGRDGSGTPLPDPGTVPQIARKGIGFTRSADGLSYTNVDLPRVIVRPLSVQVLPASVSPDVHPVAGKPGQGGVSTTLVNGFRWTDRSGDWIEYDNFGRISSYGDRNDVRVWFQYGSKGQLERVLDDNGRTVYTLLYTPDGNYLTEARDHTGANGVRRVVYHYDANGRLDQVTNARGFVTRFEYAPQTKPETGGVLGNNTGGTGTTGGNTTTGSTTGGVVVAGAGTPPAEKPFTTGYEIAKVVDAEGRTTEFRYSSTARLKQIVAPDGGVTDLDYEYDKTKKEFGLVVTHPATESGRGREHMRYDQEGRLVVYEANGKPILSMSGDARNASFTDMRGATTKIARDTFDQTTERINPDGSKVTYKYASNSLDLTDYVDEAGIATKIRYDGFGNVRSVDTAVDRPEAQRTEYIANGRGEIERIIRKGGPRPDGGVDEDADARMEYDANGNVSKLTDGEGHVWQYVYNNLGQITQVTDPNNLVSRFEYDENGNVVSTRDPTGATTAYTYDKTDRPLSVTDARGKRGEYGYDAAGRMQRIVDPTGAAVQMQYDKTGKLLSMTDAEGLGGRMYYDNFGRTRRFVDGVGSEVSLDYADPDGVDRGSPVPSKMITPTITQLSYRNARGWLTQNSVTAGDVSLTSRYHYDVRGSMTEVVDPAGKSSRANYDALGRPVSQTDAQGNVTRLDYDHRDNVVRVTDARGNSTTMTYDRANKLVSETNPLGLTTRYEYDPAGRMTRLLRPSGVSISLAYDDDGRLIERTARRLDGTIEGVDRFQWDEVGNPIAWESPQASSVLTYDDNGQLLSEAVTRQGVTLRRSYTYYANKRVKTYTGPDGTTIQYAYNRNGQLDKVEIPGAGAITVTGRKWLSPTEITYPGGSRLTIARDAFGDPVDVRLVSPTQVERYTQQYAHAQTGELTQRSGNGHSATYRYNDNLQLTGVDASGFGNDQNFTLDPVGNRIGQNGVAGEWSYDAANRLLRRGDVTYDYDQDGNLVRRTDAGASGANRVTRYRYDAYNHLIEVRDGDDLVISRYSYDPFGYRLTKEVTALGAARSGVPEGFTIFLQSSEGVLAEANSDGSVRRSYGWAPDSDHGVSPLYLRQGTETYFYLIDATGAPSRLIDINGNVVWSAEYDAFGNAQLAAGNLIEQPWRLPGQYADVETGLLYNLYRYYDPQIGRYITSDPIGLEGGINNYVYAAASPTLFHDPRGLWVGIDDLGAMAIGAVIDVGFTAIADIMSDNADDITWEDYVGAVVGGIVGGEAALYVTPVGGACVAGGVGNAVTQALKIASGKRDHFDYCSLLGDTAKGCLFGFAGKLAGKLAGPVMKGLKNAASRASGALGKGAAKARKLANSVGDWAKKLFNRGCGNSFDAETLVQTDRGLIRIADVKVGDKVLARNELTGEESYQEVLATHANWHDTTLTVDVEKGDEHEAIITTDEHPFFVFDKGFIPASELQPGDVLLLANGQRAVVALTHVNPAGQLAYNLTVANAHTYFVGRSGVWVHNSACLTPSLTSLSNQAAQSAKGGFTAGGRALQKHGSATGKRTGSKWEQPDINVNRPAEANARAQDIIDDILTSPGSTLAPGPRNGWKVTTVDGREVHFYPDGSISLRE